MSVRELQHIPLLMQEHGTKIYRIIHTSLEKAYISPNIARDNLSGDVILSCLLQDTGIAFAPRFAVQKALEKGLIKEIQIF